MDVAPIVISSDEENGDTLLHLNDAASGAAAGSDHDPSAQPVHQRSLASASEGAVAGLSAGSGHGNGRGHPCRLSSAVFRRRFAKRQTPADTDKHRQRCCCYRQCLYFTSFSPCWWSRTSTLVFAVFSQ